MFAAHVLEPRLKGERGLSVTRFVLSHDGPRLIVQTEGTTDELSEPLRFSTTYAREGGG